MRARWALRTFGRQLGERGRPIILMYHRVAHVECDPWQLAVRPELFANQIEALARERHVVPLRWLVRKLGDGRVPRNTAVVTFDDGYADVLTNARHVLERYECPATVFLTTGPIGSQEEFWWDELSRVVLESLTLPAELEIELYGQMHRWQLDQINREELHLALWHLLLPLDAASRRDVLEILSVWAGIGRAKRPESRVLDAGEVRRLAAPGFIDIGAHTVTHPSMPLLDPLARRAEVEGSRRACEELIGSEIDAFAYPFGDLDDASVDDVREAGFAMACSTEGTVVTRRSDPLRLPRIAVGNWESAEFVHELGQLGL